MSQDRDLAPEAHFGHEPRCAVDNVKEMLKRREVRRPRAARDDERLALAVRDRIGCGQHVECGGRWLYVRISIDECAVRWLPEAA